jgi:plasmid stability protein
MTAPGTERIRLDSAGRAARPVRFRGQIGLRARDAPGLLLSLTLVLPGLTACVGLQTAANPPVPAAQSTAAPQPVTLMPYLDTLARMAPGDPQRQRAELAGVLAAAQQTRSADDRLRYALALGSAGHSGSNPVEARRLVAELLAGPNDLEPPEVALASAYLREFDARVALYAELARQREESEQKFASRDATADRRADALAAENKWLKRALAEAERKLEAVAEMERSLLEQEAEPEEEAPPRP